MKDADPSLFLLLMMMLIACCVTKFYATILVLRLEIEVLEHSGAVI